MSSLDESDPTSIDLPGAVQVLDASVIRVWFEGFHALLAAQREEIDALNVYPVADSDTGTNLYLTVAAAVSALPAPEGDAGHDAVTAAQLLDAMARATLRAARGNSGTILAQILRGIADEASSHAEGMSSVGLAAALQRGNDQAWEAVMRPVPGTILSVSAAVSASAAEHQQLPLAELVGHLLRSAEDAVTATPSQLDVLRQAGVVDAGGRGYLALIEALNHAVVPGSRAKAARRPRPAALPKVEADSCHDLDPNGPSYEVMCLLDVPGQDAAARITELRHALDALGDSVVVVGGAGQWNVHVHVNDPGAAIERVLAVGHPHNIRISHFADQIASRRPDPTAVGMVACAAGPGLAQLYIDAGAEVVVTGPGKRPDTAELMQAIRATAAGSVIVIPNDRSTLEVSQAASSVLRADGIKVSVVPTRAQVQGLAAAAVYDSERSVRDNLVAMAAASASVRDGAVTVATQDAITSAGRCRAGDVLGLIYGDFVIVGQDVSEVAHEVCRRLLSSGGELLTLVQGVDADPDLAAEVAEHVTSHTPGLDVDHFVGDQDRYLLLIGVE